MARLLPDPPSRSGRILTTRELEATLRVLTALLRPQPATVVMSWDNDMQDMLGSLKRASYVEESPSYGRAPQKSTAPFRSDVLVTTALGRQYLASIRNPISSSHARRKTPKQLDREIAQSLATSSQPELAALFRDPAASKAFAQEMRHEIQKKQTSERTAAALAEKPFAVKRWEGTRRDLFGRYASEEEARAVANRIHGWVEHKRRIIYSAVPSIST